MNQALTSWFVVFRRSFFPVFFALMAAAILVLFPDKAWLGLPLFLLFSVLMDEGLGVDRSNVSRSLPGSNENLLRVGIYFYLPIHFFYFAYGIFYLAHDPQLMFLPYLGAALFMGFMAGILGIPFAHELFHSSSKVDRFLGRALLTTVCYTSYSVEHVRWHHKYYGTELDVGTAPKGESFYRFFLKNLKGSYVSPWILEKRNSKRRGSSFWLVHKAMLSYVVSIALFLGVVFFFAGIRGLAYALMQSFMAIFTLETMAYIQHYGLKRKKNKNGSYERATARHSWDCYHRYTQVLSFNAARHADHHLDPFCPSQVLQVRNKAPQLPHGYSTMILLTWVPPVFRRVMDPLLEEKRVSRSWAGARKRVVST